MDYHAAAPSRRIAANIRAAMQQIDEAVGAPAERNGT
jgi:hypothetical protein